MKKEVIELFHSLPGKLKGSAVATGGAARKAMVLSGGAAIALAINLLLSPFIARVYSPASVGKYGLFMSFLTIAAVGLSLRYELGIISAKDESDGARLVFLGLLLCVPASLLCSAALFVIARHSLFGFGLLPAYAPQLMFAVLMLNGVFTVLRYWEIRKSKFGTISRSFITQHAVRSASQIGLGVFHSSTAGLLLGEVLGRCGGLNAMLRDAIPAVKPHILRSNMHDLRETLKAYRKFPMYSLGSEFIDSFSVNMVVPLLVLLHGAEAGGYFALVQRLMAVPIYLVSSNVADVFHNRFADRLRDHPELCPAMFRDTGLILGAMGILPAGLLMLFGRPLFVFLFGPRWAPAGDMASAVAPWSLAQFIVNPLSRVVPVLSGQEFKLIYDFFKIGSVAAVFLTARYYGFAELQTVRWLSLANILSYLVYYAILRYLLQWTLRRAEAPIRDEAEAVLSGPTSPLRQ
jgi:O-antigen/teichoic acid export membrane protein